MKALNLSRTEKSLFAAPLLVVAVVLGWSFLRGDAIDRKMRAFTEPGMIDCGRTIGGRLGVSDFPAMNCAVAAAKAGKPFRIRLFMMDAPRGSFSESGLVGTSDGKLTTISGIYRLRGPLRIKQWEYVKVHQGKCIIKSLMGYEEVSMANSKQIE